MASLLTQPPGAPPSKDYIGTSYETKPESLSADGEEMPIGSSFTETDTGKTYRWDGMSWKHPAAPDEQLQTLQLILAELTQLRELVGLALATS